jgi:hypothetical protein
MRGGGAGAAAGALVGVGCVAAAAHLSVALVLLLVCALVAVGVEVATRRVLGRVTPYGTRALTVAFATADGAAWLAYCDTDVAHGLRATAAEGDWPLGRAWAHRDGAATSAAGERAHGAGARGDEAVRVGGRVVRRWRVARPPTHAAAEQPPAGLSWRLFEVVRGG